MAGIQDLLQSSKCWRGFFQCECKPLKIVGKMALAQQSTVILRCPLIEFALISSVCLDAVPPFGDTDWRY